MRKLRAAVASLAVALAAGASAGQQHGSQPVFVFWCDGGLQKISGETGVPKPGVNLVQAGLAPKVRDGCAVEDLRYDPASRKVVVITPREPEVDREGRRHYDLVILDPSDLGSFKRVELADLFLGSPSLIGASRQGVSRLAIQFRTDYDKTGYVALDLGLKSGVSLAAVAKSPQNEATRKFWMAASASEATVSMSFTDRGRPTAEKPLPSVLPRGWSWFFSDQVGLTALYEARKGTDVALATVKNGTVSHAVFRNDGYSDSTLSRSGDQVIWLHGDPSARMKLFDLSLNARRELSLSVPLAGDAAALCSYRSVQVIRVGKTLLSVGPQAASKLDGEADEQVRCSVVD